MKNIHFVHPDLGIGGAERLVVDAACGLQDQLGYSVVMHTSHYDPTRCFQETARLKIIVAGDIYSPLSAFSLPLAIFRNLILSIHMIFTTWIHWEAVDVLIVDQISASIPLFLVFMPSTKILFYCHFPDKLLSRRSSLLKKIYRFPLDMLEEVTTVLADCIVVNSKYTQSIFKSAFPLGSFLEIRPDVLYPSISVPHTLKYKQIGSEVKRFVSINRYEQKKNISIAVESFSQLDSKENAQLIIAGGYDPRMHENVQVHLDLQKLASKYSLTFNKEFIDIKTISDIPQHLNVAFLKNISNDLKSELLQTSLALIYTPENEHFGIVPVEAMANECVVVAHQSGGPTESIVDPETGFLFTDLDSMATVMNKLIKMDDQQRLKMGQNGRKRAIELFSLSVFTHKLNSHLTRMKYGKARMIFYALLFVILGAIIKIM